MIERPGRSPRQVSLSLPIFLSWRTKKSAERGKRSVGSLRARDYLAGRKVLASRSGAIDHAISVVS